MPTTQVPLGTRPLTALPHVGDVLIDKFLLEDVLGEGGMCVVFGARHLQLEGRVAIKFLRPDVVAEAANPDDVVARFLREGVAANQIRSEHVVRTFDVGTLPTGEPFLVMEHLDGRDLDALLAAHGPLPIEAAVDYVLQAGEAIAEAHSLGIIHRDLKPANLFLTHHADGAPFVKVLDFGISKLIEKRSALKPRRSFTGTASVLGTPHYMSPEQLRASRDVDLRTDIWSIGAILHELLSGEPPFKGATMPEICANILKDPPTPLTPLRPEVSLGLQTVVLRCLEKEPRARFGNMGELATALSEFATPAGRASAHRIAGIARSHVPDQGGFVVEPGQEGPTWGSTDPSWDSIPTAALVSSRRRRLGRVVFGLVMTAVGALLVFEMRGPARLDRLLETTASEVATRARGFAGPGLAPSTERRPAVIVETVTPPSTPSALPPNASADANAPHGPNAPIASSVDAGAHSPGRTAGASRGSWRSRLPREERPSREPTARVSTDDEPPTRAINAAPSAAARENGDGLFEERK